MTKNEYEHIIALLVEEVNEWRASRNETPKSSQEVVDEYFGKDFDPSAADEPEPNPDAQFWADLWTDQALELMDLQDELVQSKADTQAVTDFTNGFITSVLEIFSKDAREINELRDEVAELYRRIDRLSEENDVWRSASNYWQTSSQTWYDVYCKLLK